MPILKLKGEQYEVKRSDKPDKKLMVKCDGKWVHFGARGMKQVRPLVATCKALLSPQEPGPNRTSSGGRA